MTYQNRSNIQKTRKAEGHKVVKVADAIAALDLKAKEIHEVIPLDPFSKTYVAMHSLNQ